MQQSAAIVVSDERSTWETALTFLQTKEQIYLA